MTKRNELLDKDIQERIDNARFEKGDEEKQTVSLLSYRSGVSHPVRLISLTQTSVLTVYSISKKPSN